MPEGYCVCVPRPMAEYSWRWRMPEACRAMGNRCHTCGETPVSGFSTPIHALPAVTKEASPWIRWLNRDELARVADPTIGARVPHTAVRVLSKALESGPVLLSIPQDGITEALSCSQCHRQARCAQCSGPLERLQDGSIRCRWCGAATVQWSCPACHNERMRVVRSVRPVLRRNWANCSVACRS